MKVAVPVEIYNREWASKLMLASMLIQSRCEVVLGSNLELLLNLDMIAPDVLLIPNADYSESLERRYKEFREHGGRIVLLENEGAVFPDISHCTRRLDKKMLLLVDRLFVWSERVRDFLVSSNTVPAHKIVVTGHPNMDLPKPEFDFFYKREVEYINRTFDNLILVNTNFSLVNSFLPGQYKRFETDEKVSYFRKIQKEFIALIFRLSQHYPEKAIVLRPHPSEDLNHYSDLFSDLQNVTVTREMPVHSWIRCAEVLIHNSCTTAIEARLAGKRVISFQPEENLKYDNPLPNECGYKASSIDRVIEYIEAESLAEINVDSLNLELENFRTLGITNITREIMKLDGAYRGTKRRLHSSIKGIKETVKPFAFGRLSSALPKAYKEDSLYQKNKFEPLTTEALSRSAQLASAVIEAPISVALKRVPFLRRVYRLETYPQNIGRT